MKQDKFICFIHIEKCAGTSLNRMLHNNYSGFFNISSRDKICWNGAFTAEQFKFFKTIFPFISGMGGHSLFTTAGYEKHVDLPISYFTFLRNPIKRYISHINYQIHEMKIPWTIEQFLDDPQFTNFQTKRIAGTENIELAQNILREKYDFVGLVEKFDLSLLILKECLGLDDMNIHYEKANVAKAQSRLRFDDLPPEIKDRVTEANAMDLKLYDFALNEIFNKYEPEKYAEELLKFQEENQTFKFNKWKQFQRKLKNQLTIKVVQPISMYFT
ncbi:MAG: sulfotransferase family 2 domain-containing protein [Chitinophagales bacterium]|nr:sulfotransferase family 2 domain-containing protein [Chitinophagales bacterium]